MNNMMLCPKCFRYIKRSEGRVFQRTNQSSSLLCSSCYREFIKESEKPKDRKTFKWGNLNNSKSNELEFELGDK